MYNSLLKAKVKLKVRTLLLNAFILLIAILFQSCVSKDDQKVSNNKTSSTDLELSSTTAVAGNGQAIIEFVPSATAEGTYTVTSNPGNKTNSGPTSPIVVSSLTNGVAYTFKITNSKRPTLVYNITNRITPGNATANAKAPGAPTIGVAQAGNSQATVTFSPPTNIGGANILYYTVTSNPGNIAATAIASPVVVKGLSNGTIYNFSVKAINAAGTSTASSLSNIITPQSFPSAPEIGLAVAGNANAVVHFSAPTVDNGAKITSYMVTSNPGNIQATGSVSPLIVNGLTNGITYNFTVKAVNAVGVGEASKASNSIVPTMPLGIPGAPIIGAAVAGNANATVSFMPPAINGGAVITNYTVTSNPGNLQASKSTSPIIVSGLTNGIAYTFTVKAINSVGTGMSSGASNSVQPKAPVTISGAPVIGVAVAGNANATINFTPPASNGGGVITSYTAVSNPGNISSSGPTSPIIINGLTNGTAYTFTVKAINSAGVSANSALSNSVKPAVPAPSITAPGSPTIGTATAGNANAAVSFTPPASNGGSGVTSYSVTSNPGNLVAMGSSSPITISGLTNGVAYTFSVKAINAVGAGAASAATNSVRPAAPAASATVPGIPTLFFATPGDASASVTFNAPTSDGGSPITSYTVSSTPGNLTASGLTSPIKVTGLTNGISYTFVVVAKNAIGSSPASNTSTTIKPTAGLSAPGAPTIGVAVAGDKSATVNFSAPASNGGAAITSYSVTTNPGGVLTISVASPIKVTGLTNGVDYTFTVSATNSSGTGLASAPSNIVKPVSAAIIPGAPIIGVATATNAQASISFSAPVSNGGSPITSYSVTSNPGSLVATGAASPISIVGLANGTAYTFSVKALNSVGAGAASSASNSVTPKADSVEILLQFDAHAFNPNLALDTFANLDTQSPLSFGKASVDVVSDSDSVRFRMFNNSAVSANISIAFTGDIKFSSPDGELPVAESISAKSFKEFKVIAQPSSTGEKTGYITITAGQIVNKYTFTVNGL